MPMNSPIDFAYLKQMYDSEVVIGEKTPDELLGWLQNQFDLAEVSFSILFSSILTELIKCNAEQAITNVKKLSRDDMTFHVFRIWIQREIGDIVQIFLMMYLKKKFISL